MPTAARHGAELAAAVSSALALDLPGFGTSAKVDGYSVEEMAAQVIAAVHALQHDGPWILVGPSMGGKAAAAVAGSPLDRLAGLVLISPWPASPGRAGGESSPDDHGIGAADRGGVFVDVVKRAHLSDDKSLTRSLRTSC